MTQLDFWAAGQRQKQVVPAQTKAQPGTLPQQLGQVGERHLLGLPFQRREFGRVGET